MESAPGLPELYDQRRRVLDVAHLCVCVCVCLYVCYICVRVGVCTTKHTKVAVTHPVTTV